MQNNINEDIEELETQQMEGEFCPSIANSNPQWYFNKFGEERGPNRKLKFFQRG